MPGTIEEAKQAIATSSPESRIYLGTDSLRYSKGGRKFARYTTVIVLHVDGNRGGKLFEHTTTMEDYGSLKQRMLNEVMLTVQHGLEIVDYVGDRDFSIHIDINSNARYASHVALKEARGYILGTFGFEPQFKIDGGGNTPAATTVADHLVRRK